jgi:hypothetical protein
LRIKQERKADHADQDQHGCAYQPVFGAFTNDVQAFGGRAGL